MSDSTITSPAINEEPKIGYGGYKPCGCLVALASDGMDKKSLAKELSDWVKDGLTVGRVTRAESMIFDRCRCESKEAMPELELGL